MERYLEQYILQDIEKKMVFIGGPRQVGKTTLSKELAQGNFEHFQYLNWDSEQDRKAINKSKWRSDDPLVIFDELHKKPNWKNFIKGVFDSLTNYQRYIVTGSARLDTYKRGGDSLMGRYHYWRLHPFTLDEKPDDISSEEAFKRLMTLGGFPEPFLANNEREARRWRRERFDRVLREDVQDLEQIRHIQSLSLFVDLLRDRVGNLITLSNLAEDLQVSPKTCSSWLKIIENMYIAFPIYPYMKKVPRSILKPPKVFFYDNADVTNGSGATLENLIATHLLKRLHFIEDYFGYSCQLHYIRDRDGREVDFVTIINQKIYELIEVKTSNSSLSKSLQYYHNMLDPQRTTQIVENLEHSYHKNGILVTSPIDYFSRPVWDEPIDYFEKDFLD